MKEEFVPYEEALALKELKFDESCIYYVDKQNNSFIYNFQTHPAEFIEWCGVSVIPTPTYSQAFRFFRKKYGLDSWVEETNHGIDNGNKQYIFQVPTLVSHLDIVKFYDTHEEAELACLKKLIEIQKQIKR